MEENIFTYYDGRKMEIGDKVSYIRKGERVYSIKYGIIKKFGKKKVVLENASLLNPKEISLRR